MCKTKVYPLKNIKFFKFRVLLACDRRYDTFDLKKKKKTLYFRSNLLKPEN